MAGLINQDKKCPYCGEPAGKVTCGKPACQVKNAREKCRRWWSENRHLYKRRKD